MQRNTPRAHSRRQALALPLRPAALSIALGLLALPPGFAHAQGSQVNQQQYDLPAGPLDATLTRIARKAGRVTTLDPKLVAGLQAAPVKGELSPEQAFARALAGTGLEMFVTPGGALSVRPAPVMDKHGDATLAPVIVTATPERDGTTEGTGSYTTRNSNSATGLTLSLRETPQSVTVITRQRIEDQAMSTIRDAMQAAVGVSVMAFDRGRNRSSARGFDINNFQIDGVPVEANNVSPDATSTVIYDRVEVVRGPTGLLNGAGDPSASINMVRKRADSDRFTGSVQVELGAWNHRAVTVDLSSPLNASGTVRGRLVAHGMEENSFMDLEHKKTSVFYGTVEADLTPFTRLSVGASQETDKRSGIYWGGLSRWFSDGTRTDWPRSKTTAARWNQWDVKEQTAFASIEHNLPERWKLRADFNYRQQTEESKMLFAYALAPDRKTGLGYMGESIYYYNQPTQKQLNLSATGPFMLWGREHELMLGLAHSRHRYGWLTADAIDPASFGSVYRWDGSYPEPTWSDVYVGDDSRTTQTAAYAAARLQLTDALKFILGARQTRLKQEEKAGAWTELPFTVTKSVLTPYGGLVYDLNKVLSLYASHTKIFKPQPSARDRNGGYLAPVEGSGTEIGMKGEFMDGRLNAGAAVFRIEQDGLAVSDEGFYVPGTGIGAMRPAKGAESQGIELDVAGEITSSWHLNAAWTKYSARDAQGENVNPDSPRQQIKLFTKYRFRGDLAGLAVGGGVAWQGTKPYYQRNPATGQLEHLGQDAFALVELMASYRINRQMSLQLNVKNLFDKAYYERSGPSYTYGTPRNFTLQLKHSF